MPTGYTADLHDGKAVSFADFALDCARAFGALVTLRDSPDADIPDEFEPASYHADRLAEAEAWLTELQLMSLDECYRRARDEFDEWQRRRDEHIREADARRQRYEDMLVRVHRWQPPTPDHVGLKEFMVDQLRKSIEFDCSTRWYPEAPPISPYEWRDGQIEKARKDIERHREEHAKEVQRAADRTAWVRALRDSLFPGVAVDD